MSSTMAPDVVSSWYSHVLSRNLAIVSKIQNMFSHLLPILGALHSPTKKLKGSYRVSKSPNTKYLSLKADRITGN